MPRCQRLPEGIMDDSFHDDDDIDDHYVDNDDDDGDYDKVGDHDNTP